MSFKAFYSNRLEKLYDYLKDALFSPPAHAFTRRMVMVPSPSMKSWLMLRLAKDPEVGMAAGMEIGHLDELVQKARGQWNPKNSHKKIPVSVELGLAIENELRTVHAQFDSLSGKEQEIYSPLLQYLHLDPGRPLSKKSERRVIDLAYHLMELFSSYATQGGQMVAEWKLSPLAHWQQGLWNRLFHPDSPWTYLAHELNNFSVLSHPPQECQVHLFSIGYLPPLYHRYLNKLSRHAAIYYYILSPCQYFWSDIRSDRETYFLVHSLQRQKAAGNQLDQLEDMLRDRNPLLANFGRIGRAMAELADDDAGEAVEHYLLPEEASHYPQLQAMIPHNTELFQKNGPLTLLEAVQADMLLLRNPDREPKLSFKEWDGSIQVHSSSTKSGEIRMLYNLLMHLMERHAQEADPISPGDIIVMAPDISQYEPYIRKEFEGPESQLEVQMMDLQISAENRPLQAFLHLVSLSSGRWEASSLLALFDFPAFQKKQGWGNEELYEIRQWIERSEIRWGNDARHRKELMAKDHGPEVSLEDSFAGTWDFGLQRLLAGLAYEESEEGGKDFPVDPLDVDSSSTELLGIFFKLLKSLGHDLQPLSQNVEKPMKEWVEYLQHLNEAYFDFDEEEESRLILQGVFTNLKSSARHFSGRKFSFESIRKYMDALLNTAKTTYRESRLDAVHFCSLVPMRTIPAKIIVILGLEEESYPRRERRTSLNRLADYPEADYYPSQTDFDRYLFLEALLSARRYFVLSHLNLTQDDFKEQQGSLLVEELVDYLDKAYEVHGKAPSQFCRYKHPFHPFDKAWFDDSRAFKSYSQKEYRLACSHYNPDKIPPHQFIPSFPLPVFEPPSEGTALSLSEINAFAKNSIKTYFNKTLGMYLPFDKDKPVENEEALLPSYLQRDYFKKISLRQPFEEICARAERKGAFGSGFFKELSVRTLEDKVSEVQDRLKEAKIHPQDLFEIVFSDGYAKAEKSKEGHWLLPPLCVSFENGKSVKIIGKIKNVSAYGLVEYADEKKDISKIWPEYLVFHTLVQQHSLPIEPNLFFAKKGKMKKPFFDKADERLKLYLAYLFDGMKSPSPLIPEWIPLFIKYDKETLLDKLKNMIYDPNSRFYNDYALWIFRETVPEDVVEWKGVAKKIFGEAYKEWDK